LTKTTRKLIGVIFPTVEDVITVAEAAEALGTTPPTVRKLLGAGKLTGGKETHRSRFHWKVDGKSVERFLSEHGRFPGGFGAPSRIRVVQAAVEGLENRVNALGELRGEDETAAPTALSAERDDLRARVIALEDALVRMNEVAELQRAADAERSLVVEHLLAANGAAERADALRREAVTALEEALAGFSRPGHTGSI
jgi:excisionase family DNA binding protein